MSFGLDFDIDGSVGRVGLSGECDLAAVASVGDCVARLLRDPTVTSVVIDLSAVTFVDSSGIGALVAGRRRAEQTGKDLTVTGATGQVERVLTMMGVLAYLSVPTGRDGPGR